MRLATIRIGGRTRAVRTDDDGLVDVGAPDVGELLGHQDWAERARSATAASAATYPAAGAEYAPVVPRPSKVICVGLNYRSHILEMGRALPEHPTLFAKWRRACPALCDDVIRKRSMERGPALVLQAADTGGQWNLAGITAYLTGRANHLTTTGGETAPVLPPWL